MIIIDYSKYTLIFIDNNNILICILNYKVHNVYIIQLQNVQYVLITRKFFRSQSLLRAACPIKRSNTKISAQKRKRQSKDTKTKQKGSKKPKVTDCITAGYAACHKITTKIPIYDVNRSSQCLCDHPIRTCFTPGNFDGFADPMKCFNYYNATYHYTHILVL